MVGTHCVSLKCFSLIAVCTFIVPEVSKCHDNTHIIQE